MIAPQHFWIPPRVGSYGDEAIDLAAEAGWTLDEEQKLGVNAMLSYGPGGAWIALESAFIEARQNGKTARVLQPVALFDMFLMPPDDIMWTAHRMSTVLESFQDFQVAIATSPTLSRRVKKICIDDSDQHILLHNGAKMAFRTRTGDVGRGLGGKRVVMDEALVLSAGLMGSLMPTLSARPNAQLNYGSSAGKTTSAHLANLVRRGRAGNDPTLIWVEYCAPGSWENPPCDKGRKCLHYVGTPGCALDDERLWPYANHTVGNRITYAYVRAERRTLAVAEFGRERMGWHETVVSESRPISDKQWTDLVDILSSMTDPVAVGMEVNHDRTASAIGVAGYREDGQIHLEIIKAEPGVSWLVDDVVTVVEKFTPCVVVLDDKSEAASLLPDLKEKGLLLRNRDPKKPAVGAELIVTTWAADLARASGAFYDRVTESKTIRHLNQPETLESLQGAVWRQLGDAKAFDRKAATTNQAPLFALVLALYGLLVYGPSGPVVIDGDLMA